MSHIIKYKLNFFVLILIICTAGCKKWIEVDAPVDKPSSRVIYESDDLATAVLTGLYSQMSAGSFATGRSSISVRAGLSADELTGYSSTGSEPFMYYQNNLNASTSSPWSELYKFIYTTNSAIEGLNRSTKLSEPVKRQLLGEAHFMRAFLFFYVVNLYGNAPMPLNTDFLANSEGTRISQDEVYKQIIKDLVEAKGLLNDNFVSLDLVTPTIERVRPNKGTATAMLARVYLFMKDYSKAEIESSLLIENKTLYDTVSLNQVFLKNSKEAIWQIQPVAFNFNTQDGFAFNLFAPPNSLQPATVSPQLINSFSNGDLRKSSWINLKNFGTVYYTPFKYKVWISSNVTEYLMVLRIGEQYLIRAEARAQLNKISESIQDINLIRKRAGLPDTTAISQQSLLEIIEHERQLELFSEWGHRWLDLKRTQRIDAVMGIIAPLKGGGIWQSYKQLYPIPLRDIQTSNSLSQNDGY